MTREGRTDEDALAPLHALARRQLLVLADVVEAGRLRAPTPSAVVERFVPAGQVAGVCAVFDYMASAGASPLVIGMLLRGLARERAALERAHDRVSLVWTGPELPGAESRDTAVVTAELFAQARAHVLVTGFVVHGGRRVFAALAARMAAVPALRVRLCLNVPPLPGAPLDEYGAVRAFARRFATEHWPGTRTPELFYDPRALSPDSAMRGVLHAKCVVVDDEVAFVGSANLTDAAQHRNVEAGVLVRDATFAARLRQQFDSLIEHGLLRAFGP